VPIVATQEGFVDKVVFMIEQGQIDGITSTGLNFGAMYNPGAIIDDGYQFDFFHGGGLNICFLGFAQIDQYGNVNSSRFGDVLTGCGGFIDISQHTGKVVFCGAFAAKSAITIGDGKLKIEHPGKVKKMIKQVEQITFNGNLGRKNNQQVLYVTERAVFRLVEKGIKLLEIAPGVDMERDILQMMDFEPIMDSKPKLMAEAIFSDQLMHLTL
jgi:propionate CoA-transferase